MTKNLKECKRQLKLVLTNFNCELADDYGVLLLIDKAKIKWSDRDTIELDHEDLNVY